MKGFNPQVTTQQVSSSSLRVSWTQSEAIPDDLKQYYGYTVAYKAGDSDYVNGPDAPHVAGQVHQSAVVDGLMDSGQYLIKVRPYRHMGNERDYGWSSHTVTANITTTLSGTMMLINWCNSLSSTSSR